MNRRGLLTIVGVFIGLFMIFFGLSLLILVASGGSLSPKEKIAVVEINGPIMESKKIVQALRDFSRDEEIKAIVVRIDSPGGAVAPSQEMHDAVRKAKAKKPLVVSMGGTAASGGYYIAVGADTIFANAGTVTGSIGVITQLIGFHKLVEMTHLDINTFTTGPYKDAGSPLKPLSDQDRAYFNALIGDIYDQFVKDVAEGRKLKIEQVKPVADGRVFTGRQALELKLVDKIGSFDDAVEFIAKEAKIEGEPELVYPPQESQGLLGSLVQQSVQDVVQSVRATQTPAIEYRYVGP
jgi:protease-4